MSMRKPWPDALWAACALALGVGMSACGGVDTIPVTPCDPVDDTGCPAGEHCRLGEEARTLCLAPEPPVAARCSVGSCAPGEACADVEGYLECRPVCRLDAPDCPAPATCSHALDADFGVCVAPCRPFPEDGIDDCPDGACAPVLAAPFPICVGLGAARLGDDCTETRCGRALACLSADDGVLCRAMCRLGEDALCPAPQVCSGEVADRGLGFCRAPEADAGVR
jgi:hypothetical protein